MTNLDDRARAMFGKAAEYCSWDELRELVAQLEAENARATAGADQVEAAMSEARECGCASFAVPQHQDGSHDFARARVSHTCGGDGV